MSATVLVVDDSPTIRKVVTAILERHSYQTVAAENGEDALEKLEKHAIDLVLLDFVMPKMNGYQFCREIRSSEKYAALPVVLMSAKGDKIRGQFVQQTGALDAITKPFDSRALVAVIESALSRHTVKADRADLVVAEADDENTGVFDIQELELSSDSSTRRTQVAQIFAQRLAQVLAPHLKQLDSDGAALEQSLEKTLERVLTPNRLSKLSSLLSTLESGADAAVLSGDLGFISIAEVLQMLELQRQTGTLVVSRPEGEIRIYLSSGKLDLAQGRGLPLGFRIGRYLVEANVVTREALLAVLEDPAQNRRLIGEVLVAQGQATPQNISDALYRQTSEMIYELVRWEAGRFAFMTNVVCPEATLAQLGLAPGGLLMEGFRRVDEWRLIEGSFDFDEVLYRDQVSIDRGDRSELNNQEKAVLEAIDGTKSVREIVDHVGSSTFDVCKILFQFLNSRLVRRKAA